MRTWRAVTLTVVALLAVTLAGCGAPDEEIATGASTAGASTTVALQTTKTPATTPDDGLAEEYEVYSALTQSVLVEAAQPPGATLGRATDASRRARLDLLQEP